MLIDHLLRKPEGFMLIFPPSVPSLILMLGYLAFFAYVLWRRRDDFRKLNRRTGPLLIALLVLVMPLSRLLPVGWGSELVVPPGPMTVLPFVSAIPLLATALIAVIAYAFGPAPGLLAGLVGAVAWARYTPLMPTDMLALAMWGYMVGAFLGQRYRGDVFSILRRPVTSCVLASLLTVLQVSLSRVLAVHLAEALRIIDFVVVLWRNELPLWLAVGGGIGLVFEAVVHFKPAWRPPVQGDVPSFYSKSLSAQLMVYSVPIVLLSMLFSVLAVINRSVTLARSQASQEMERSALIASRSLQQFYITGEHLIQTFVGQPQLVASDVDLQAETLDVALNLVPYFRQFLLVAYREGAFEVHLSVSHLDAASAGEVALTDDELGALEMMKSVGVGTQKTEIAELVQDDGTTGHGYSIVGCVQPESVAIGCTNWYLVGRVLTEGQPDLRAVLSALQQPAMHDAGAQAFQYRGFVVDKLGRIVIHPDADQLYSHRVIGGTDGQALDTVTGTLISEWATPENERVLGYILKVESLPLWIVLELPYVDVLSMASETAGSMIVVQLIFGLTLLVAIPLLTSRITRPLNALAQAAGRIARGDLQGHIVIAGDDEVAHLGDALEQMRGRLQERLNDLSLLLDISQKVSATLDLDRGIMPILEGALVETSGTVARFIMLRENGRSVQTYSAGDTEGDLGQLDRALTNAVIRRKEPLVIHDLTRAHRQLEVTPPLRSVAAFPVRSQESPAALFWIGTREPNVFDEARINFLSTLAGQAAVLIENARLFQTTEGGRQRLAAILSSTRDAILVVDAEGHLLLTNPAAQRLFGIAHDAVGHTIVELGLPTPLVEALAAQTTTVRRMRRYQLALPKSLRATVVGEEEDEALPPVEVPLEDGRTFYASVAPIKGSDGLTAGIVVVLRDVTYFKELNELKSEFVATVSHDLRAPLTYMRGYTTMLSMVGELNDRQRDYMQRIQEGIELMNGLVGDLLDLRRVEAGVGIRQEPCRLGLIMVEAVEAMRIRATSKGVDLRLEPSEGSPTVIGDRTLLRQSIGNLVDNAIKYTPSGGEVVIGLDITEDAATIRVSDTGIGIAPADQVRLFEKFYRIKRRETGSIQGTGLGLALVKSIVERHGGRVRVDSALNHGSTFYIQLPLPPEDGDGDGA